MRINDQKGGRTRRIGRVLVLAGGAVWVPYFALKFTGRDPDLALFLPFRLMGVIPGAVLSWWHQSTRSAG